MSNDLSNKVSVSASAYSINGSGSNDDTALSLYLQEISQVKLLTLKEEITLFRKIKRAKNSRERKVLRDKMVVANLRFVVKIAKDYVGKGLPMLDLISEGNLGLIKAVERYKLSKGAKLTTYSSFWIKQNIRKALSSQSRMIRLPVHVNEKVSAIRKTIDLLSSKLRREPTCKEIAQRLGMSIEDISDYYYFLPSTISLDSQTSDGFRTVGDTISDESAEDPSDKFNQKTEKDMLHSAMENLSEREAEILKCRFGLNNHQEKTLREISRTFKVSRERIRQIEAIAMHKLRIIIGRFEKTGVMNGTVNFSLKLNKTGMKVRSYSLRKSAFEKIIVG